jgi:hypothetical protein
MKINEIISEDRERLDEIWPALAVGAAAVAPAILPHARTIAAGAAKVIKPTWNAAKTAVNWVGQTADKVFKSKFGQNPVVKPVGHGLKWTLDAMTHPYVIAADAGYLAAGMKVDYDNWKKSGVPLDQWAAYKENGGKLPQNNSGFRPRDDIPEIDIGPDRPAEIEMHRKEHYNDVIPKGMPNAGQPVWSIHDKGNDSSLEPDANWADWEPIWHWRQDKLIADLKQLKIQNKKNNTPDNRILYAPDGTTNNASEYDNLIGNAKQKAMAERKRKNIHKAKHGNIAWRHSHLDGDRDGGKDDHLKW